MRYKKERSKEGSSSRQLDIVVTPNRGGGGDHSESFGSGIWEPRLIDQTPSTRYGNDATTARRAQAPEKKLALFAFRLAVLEKAASGLGTLAFIWATVVLLGGFALKLKREDFWFVTIILSTEGARVFSRSSELEWRHQATWTLGGVGRSSFRALKSSSRYVSRAVKAIFKPLPVIQSEGDHGGREITNDDNQRGGGGSSNQVKRYTRPRTWQPHDVPLVQYADWAFLSKTMGNALQWLQIFSAVASVVLSSVRLIKQDYGEVENETTNRTPALNLFYALSLAEAFLFLLEKAYWMRKVSCGKLLERVSQDCRLGSSGIVPIRRFLYDSYSKSITGSIFEGLKMDLVTFAEELLDSDFSDEQSDGAQILQKFVESGDYGFDTLRKIGTSTRAMGRLIEMLNWKNLAEEDIRRCAAEIVKKLAGKKKNALRVARIPGSMESISSLLHTDPSSAGRSSRTDQTSTTTADEETNYDFASFNLLGLQILRKLANDHDNSGKIGNTRGLMSKVIEFANASQYLLTNERATESQIKTVRKALQVVKMLASTTGTTGKMLRKGILDNVFAVSHIRKILQYGESHVDLQRLAIEILTNLAMDAASKERIATAGGIIKLLLSIFVKPGVENQNSVIEEAGEALAMLSLENQNNCALILREKGVVKKLIGALSNQVLQLNASRILRNLCAYSGAESSNHLNGVIEAMPTVLKAAMTQIDKLLEVSLGLTVQICKLLGPEGLAQEFEKADYTETGFVEKLIQILKRYKHPEIKVPRIRRFAIQQAIWMMKSHECYKELFRKLELEKLLESVADTTSDVECFHVFSGGVGLSQHKESVSSLVEEALNLLTDGPSQEA